MEPQKSDTTIQSNITGTVIDMGFDKEASIHLMEVLTDIASDAEYYTIQEVATNARDANIEAGSKQPVEITLPTELRPEWRCKDTGPGMDAEDIRCTYSQYGASTKRKTNTQTGSLGLGCKSPLSYTSQFNVISIKDGIRIMISVSKDDDGGASMTIIEEVPTSEPSGTEVIIPAKRYNQFQEKSARIFRFWRPGEVLVNGKEPKHFEGSLQVGPTMQLVKREAYNETSYVVQGGVAYPIPHEHDPVGSENRYGRGSDYILIAEVPIGDVAFTPSREALKLNKRTVARLAKLREEYQVAAAASVQADIDKCTTAPEALAKAQEWKKALELNSEQALKLSWKGTAIPQTITAPTGEKAIIARRNDRTLSSYNSYNNIDVSWFADCLLVHGYGSQFTASHKKKLLGYCEQKNITPAHFIMTNSKLTSMWADPVSVVGWDVIKEVTLESVQGYGRGAKAITGSYKAWTPEGAVEELAGSDIDQTEPIYWFKTDEFGDRWNDRRLMAFVRRYIPKGTVIKLGENRITKFQRDFPKCKTLKMALEDAYNKKAKALGEEVIEAWEIQQSEGADALKKLDRAKIKDPELQKAIDLAKLQVSAKIQPLKDFARNNEARHLTLKGLNNRDKCYKLEKHYPLIASCTSYSYRVDQEDSYIYINAKHKEVVNGKQGSTQ